jgi:hypothetical protein
MHEFDRAFTYLQKASKIYHNALASDYVDIIRSDQDVDRMTLKVRKYYKVARVPQTVAYKTKNKISYV